MSKNKEKLGTFGAKKLGKIRNFWKKIGNILTNQKQFRHVCIIWQFLCEMETLGAIHTFIRCNIY